MSKITSNLVGARAQVTIGNDYNKLTPEERIQRKPPMELCRGSWHYWGQYGIVRAVAPGSDGGIMCSLELEEGGAIVEVYSTHLTIDKSAKTKTRIEYYTETGTAELQAVIQKKLDAGWELHGTIVVDSDRDGTQYIQAVVKTA